MGWARALQKNARMCIQMENKHEPGGDKGGNTHTYTTLTTDTCIAHIRIHTQKHLLDAAMHNNCKQRELSSTREWQFVMANGPWSIYTAYKLTVFGLVERALAKMSEVGRPHEYVPYVHTLCIIICTVNIVLRLYLYLHSLYHRYCTVSAA